MSHINHDVIENEVEKIRQLREQHDQEELVSGSTRNPAQDAVNSIIKEFDDLDNPPVHIVIAYKKANGEVGLFTQDGASFLEQLGLVDVARQAILNQNLKG